MKKLKLNKETISFLNYNTMKQIDGGQVSASGCTHKPMCVPPPAQTERSCRESCANFVGPIEPGTCSNGNNVTFYAASVCCVGG